MLHVRSANQVLLYPSPAASQLQVTAPAGSQVSFYDLSGRQISVPVTTAAGGFIADVTGLGTGHYLLRLYSGGQVTVHRFAVAR